MKFRNTFFKLWFVLAISISALIVAPANAQTSDVAASPAQTDQSFFKKKYRIKGTWSLVQRDGKNLITFSDDFKTKNGPDLKIFLSPKSAADVKGNNAVDGSLNLGVLKSNNGVQEYEIPTGTDLSKFSTFLIHCEAYAVLWGGGTL